MATASMTAAACIRSRHALSGSILRFFLAAAGDVPIQDIAPLPEADESANARLSSFLLSSPRSLARMTRRLTQSALAPAFLEADFSSLPARLIVLPGKQLGELAVYAGLAMHCRAVAAVVNGKDVHALRAAFGDAAHQFAVLRAPFFLREPERLAAALCGRAAEQPDIEELVSRVKRAGLACLSACAAALPPALEALFERKLAALSFRGMGIAPSGLFLESEEKYSLHALLEKLLRKELEQKWNPSCS